MDIVDDRPRAGPGNDRTEKIRLMDVKQVRLEVRRELCHARRTCVPLPSAFRFRQGVNNDSFFLIRLRSAALRKEMHLIARLRQFAASAMEYSAIIDRVTVTDVTDSHSAPKLPGFDSVLFPTVDEQFVWIACAPRVVE